MAREKVVLGIIISVVSLCIVGFVLGTLRGYELRPALIGVFLVIWIGAEFYLNKWRQLIKAQLKERSHEDRTELLRRGLDGALIDDFVDREVRDSRWGFNSALSGLYLFAVPPLLSAASRGNLGGESEVRGVDILWMFAGVSVFFVSMKVRTGRYRCPACKARPERLGGDALRFHCRRCRVVWYLPS